MRSTCFEVESIQLKHQREVGMKRMKLVKPKADTAWLNINGSHAVTCVTENAIAFRLAGADM